MYSKNYFFCASALCYGQDRVVAALWQSARWPYVTVQLICHKYSLWPRPSWVSSSCNDERTADQPLNCSAPVAGWPHAVTSDSIMQEPERKLSEPSVWEHPPDWQGVPSTLCKCTLSRTHSPSTVFQHLQWNSIRPPKDAAMRAFHSAHMDVSYVWCPESVKLVWMLEDSTLSLNHCKCTLLKLSQFQPRSFWQPGEVELWKRSQLLKGLALVTEENLISTGVQPQSY